MSVSRIIPVLGITVSLALVGCGSAVGPKASSSPTQPAASTPTASASGQSGAPSPSKSVAPAHAAAWLHVGDLREPRNAAHVVPVGTGQVLVVGSDNICFPATGGSDSVEFGDPQTGVWEKTASLPTPRERPALVALPGGQALLIGGETGEEGGPAAYSSTYIFDPTTRSWSPSGLLNTARTGTAAAVLADGRVLVAGGLYTGGAAQSERVLDSSEVWDPGSGAWSLTGQMAATRWGASVVTLADGRVLIVGGVASLESAPTQQASAEVYDPTTGQWSSAGTLATARSGFVLVALPDGGALVAGGSGTRVPILSSVERFDPASNTWSPAEALPVAVTDATGIELADGRVLLAGGTNHPPQMIDAVAGTFVSGLTVDAALFDPKTGTWTATVPMPSPRANASAVLLADGSAIFAGGFGSEGDFNATPGCPEADPQVFQYVPGS